MNKKKKKKLNEYEKNITKNKIELFQNFSVSNEKSNETI